MIDNSFKNCYRIYLPISRAIFSEIWICIDQKHSKQGGSAYSREFDRFFSLSGVENLWKCHANSVIGL